MRVITKKQYEDLTTKHSRWIHKYNNKWCIRLDVAFHNWGIYLTLCKKLNDYEDLLLLCCNAVDEIEYKKMNKDDEIKRNEDLLQAYNKFGWVSYN